MALTAKQEKFCQKIVEGLSASDAYRLVYDAAGKPATVNRAAHELTENPKITARIAELRAPITESVQITLKSHLEALEDLREGAKGAQQFAAAITAEIARGRVSGLYVVKVDTELKVGLGPNWEALVGAKIEDD